MTFDPNKSTRVKSALKLDKVPPEKWTSMLKRTVLGVLFIGLGIIGAAKWAWSVWVVIGLCIFGASFWSTQMVVQAGKNLIPLLKAVVDIVRGKETPQ